VSRPRRKLPRPFVLSCKTIGHGWVRSSNERRCRTTCPPNQEASATAPPGMTAGPKKPELVRAFTPMGYDGRGESGTFTMRRRTPGNLTAELLLDVSTWSDLVMAIFRVQGLVNGIGFKATLILPVARQATVGAQYPMGGLERWRQSLTIWPRWSRNSTAASFPRSRRFPVHHRIGFGPNTQGRTDWLISRAEPKDEGAAWKCGKGERRGEIRFVQRLCLWSHPSDSNRRPADYE
jgi:hypothetical protein